MNSRERKAPALPKHLKEFIKCVIWKDILEVREGMRLSNLGNAYDPELGLLPFVRYRNSVYSNNKVTKYVCEFYYKANHYRTFEDLLLAFDKDYPKYIKRILSSKVKVDPSIAKRVSEVKRANAFLI